MHHPLSYRDCTGWNLNEHPELADTLVPGSIVEKSCFSQETPDSVIFPKGMKGITFLYCNLDNCDVPDGNIIEGGSNRRFQVQNDLRDWEVDENDEPVRVINEKAWINLGKSVDPADIPETFIRKERLLLSEFEEAKESPELLSWFDKTPEVVASETIKTSMDVSPEAYESMIANGEFAEFDEAPTAQKILLADGSTSIRLTGPATYVVIEGEGKFDGGIGQRSFLNDPHTDVADAAEVDEEVFVVEDDVNPTAMPPVKVGSVKELSADLKPADASSIDSVVG